MTYYIRGRKKLCKAIPRAVKTDAGLCLLRKFRKNI